ncbi:hypothetical protein KUTeg_010855 [Tegillarca granosa]|uniref:Uncharacterized protein n=1 Tax=Tegillarca granosa TaxID=220873 RepID=A0ABQ9F5I2_TEGGR|nr:hypothetical protein KUTeg_010855 [Tegillarca granosa]
MGVDIGTYRCRIGQCWQRNGTQVVQITITCNFTGSLKMIGSVIFIGTLLIMAGIEPNPGPLPDEKSMAGMEPKPGPLPDKASNTGIDQNPDPIRDEKIMAGIEPNTGPLPDEKNISMQQSDSTKQGQEQNHQSQQLDRTVAGGSDFLICFQKIWIENIYPETSHEELTNFIKINTTQDVSSLVFEEMYKETAIVSFENMIESKKDKDDFAGCTICFWNKKNVFNEELLVLYFANNRQTGGGPNFVEIDETTAETVLKKTTHNLFDVKIHISLYVAGLNEDKNKIRIENIDPKIDEELLINFIEARTKTDVSDIRILKDKEIAILTLKDDIDFQVMKTQIESRKLKGRILACKPETNIPESFGKSELSKITVKLLNVLPK